MAALIDSPALHTGSTRNSVSEVKDNGLIDKLCKYQILQGLVRCSVGCRRVLRAFDRAAPCHPVHASASRCCASWYCYATLHASDLMKIRTHPSRLHSECAQDLLQHLQSVCLLCHITQMLIYMFSAGDAAVEPAVINQATELLTQRLPMFVHSGK